MPSHSHPPPLRLSPQGQALRQATDACRECPVGAGATQSVPGEGPLPARLMLVGEQPLEVEDLLGSPFRGPAATLLQEVFQELGWPREQLYLSYALKHFKHEARGRRRLARRPTLHELQTCLHWLEAEIGLARPGAIVALGEIAARALLGRPVELEADRGRWHHHRSDGRPVLVTLDPERMLRLPPARRQLAWDGWIADLRLAQPWMQHDAPPP